MNVFLVDLTHGGVKISSELAKSGNPQNLPNQEIMKRYMLMTYTIH